MTVIKCDKCGSTRVTDTIPPKPYEPPKEVTMSDYAKEEKMPHVSYAIMTYTQHVLKCHDCGHEVSYSV